MKRKNFPERKNQRRKKALENLKKYFTKKASTRLETIIENTKNKIVESAIMVKTKVKRSKTL